MGNRQTQASNRILYAGFGFSLIICSLLLAMLFKSPVLTAIPIGILFGFFLQKGDLCGASAFSEVVVMRDANKLWGLWVAIVTGMAGFAILDLFSFVTLNAKPFLWMSYTVGGVLFGVGMVLAGGCVSGSLFKAGNGHLTSMAALPGIALGVALVEAGPLGVFNQYMKTHLLKAGDNGPITLSSISGLPFWLLALVLGAITVAVVVFKKRPHSQQVSAKDANSSDSPKRSFLWRRWKPWQAGIAIGILGSLAYLSSSASGRNYPLGVTHGVYHAQLLVTDSNLKHVWKKVEKSEPPSMTNETPSEAKLQPPPSAKKVSWWLVLEVLSIILGAWIAGRMSGEAKLLPKPPEQVVVAFFGGILVGAGAGLAKGCVIGNIVSGWALMSVGTMLFGVVAILSNWITSYFYLLGAPGLLGRSGKP